MIKITIMIHTSLYLVWVLHPHYVWMRICMWVWVYYSFCVREKRNLHVRTTHTHTYTYTRTPTRTHTHTRTHTRMHVPVMVVNMSLSEGGPMDFLRSSQGYLSSSLMCSNCRRLLPLGGYRGRGSVCRRVSGWGRVGGLEEWMCGCGLDWDSWWGGWEKGHESELGRCRKDKREK